MLARDPILMRLHINIDHVATVRQARRTDEPDPVRAAVLAELGGADGITVHLREDRRHIQDRDVRLLMGTVRTAVNLELAASPEMVRIGTELRPMAVTLVPERREEITTEGGLNLADDATRARVADAVVSLRHAGITVSLFVNPEPATLDACDAVGADAVELHTGSWAECWQGAHVRDSRKVADVLQAIRRASAHGRALGLAVHAGHGLTYENVTAIAAIREIEELNIGHSIVSRAVLVGMERAVMEMKATILRAREHAR
jgi:pyridoxine 5-phosphate synthase